MRSHFLTLSTALSILAATSIPNIVALPPPATMEARGIYWNTLCRENLHTCDTCNVTFVAVWDETGMRRYRFTFDGEDLISNYGRDFLASFRCYDGGEVANNWQCWGAPTDKTWTFDISEVDGVAGASIANKAIAAVVGKSPNIPLT